jgi:hypothetical protein
MVDGDWGRAVQGVHCVGGDGGKGPDGRIDCIDVMVEAYCRFGMGIFEWVDQSVFCFVRRKIVEKKSFEFPSSLDLLVLCRCIKSHLQPSSLTNDKKTREFTSRISMNADIPLERRIRRRVYFSSVHRSYRPPGLSVIRMSPLQITMP